MDPTRRFLFTGRASAAARTPSEMAREAAAAAGEPWIVQFGDGCLARRGVECRVCGEACDASAIRFRPRLGGIAQPELTAQACSGCGECVPRCPVGALGLVPRDGAA